MVPAATRFPRTKTALVIAAAGAVILAGLLLAPRRAHPGDAIADAGDVALDARARSRTVLRGESETDLAITIRAPRAVREAARPRIALAVVLDTSGSMSGPRIQDAKAAARHVIDELGDGDRFALIAFSSRAELLVPMSDATPAAKQRATTAIAGLAADGDTNISEALAVGAQAFGQGGSDYLPRVVLISDGKPENAGITDPEGLVSYAGELAAGKLSITTVGIGLDFDEKIMTGIAVAGRGNYYFVEDPAQLAHMFDHELDGLGQTVASQATLELAPADGVEIVEAYGYRTLTDGRATIVPIADLRAGETRKVVVRARVVAGAGGSMDLARVTLRFRTPDAGTATATATIGAAISDDVRVVDRDLDKDAVRWSEEARTARALEEATDAHQQGDDARAREILTQRAQEAQGAAAATADPALAQHIDQVTAKGAAGFAAPAASDGGKRAAKATRDDAYQLAR